MNQNIINLLDALEDMENAVNLITEVEYTPEFNNKGLDTIRAELCENVLNYIDLLKKHNINVPERLDEGE